MIRSVDDLSMIRLTAPLPFVTVAAYRNYFDVALPL